MLPRACAVLLLALVLLLPTAGSWAATQCGGVVQDPADALTQAEEVAVAASAERLAAVAVRPLVVVTEDLDGVDTEEFLRRIIEDCPGLTNSDGEWGANVLGIVVSVGDRETGVWEGGGLPALDTSLTNVDTEVMNPRFAEGDVAGGLVAGLDRLASIQAGQAAQDVADGQTEQDGGGFPWFAGGVGATALLGAGGALTARRVAKRREVLQAHAEAVATQAELAQEVVDLERDAEIATLDARALADRLGLAEATPLREATAALRGTVDSVLTRWYAVTSQIGGAATADLPTYTQAAEDLRGLTEPIAQATDNVAAFAADVAGTVELEGGLAGREQDLAGAHGVVRAGIADAQQRGYRTDPADTDLQLSIDALARAVQAREERLVATADGHLDLAEAAAADATDWVTNIEQMRTDLAAELVELRERHRTISARVEPALAAMESMETEFAPSAWEVVAGNGSEAEAELVTAAAAMDASEHAQLLDVQDWDTAEDALEVAADDLADAIELLDAIHARAQVLEDATQLAPQLVASTREIVAEARSFAAGHSADVTDAVELAIGELSQRLAAVEAALGGVRPDPTAVMAGATQIQTEVTELLATARQEVTAADLARRRADRSLATAQDALNQTVGYARGRGRYLDRGTMQVLQQLQDRLQRASVIGDPISRESEATAVAAEVRRVGDGLRRQARVSRAPAGPSYRPSRRGGGFGGGLGGGFGGSFGGSGGGSRSSSRPSRSSSSRGSSSRSRSGGSSSRRRSSSGRSRSGRSSRW